jgi:hypothetical protein
MIDTVSNGPQRPHVRQLVACLAAYVLFLLVAPAGHHDLACHVRSHSTHCTSCTASQPGFASGSVHTLGGAMLAGAGRACVDSWVAEGVLTPLRLSGRAPPRFA